MTDEEIVRRVLDLIRDGRIDQYVIRINAATRDRMREESWYLRVAHGPDVNYVRTVELPSD